MRQFDRLQEDVPARVYTFVTPRAQAVAELRHTPAGTGRAVGRSRTSSLEAALNGSQNGSAGLMRPEEAVDEVRVYVVPPLSGSVAV